MKLSCEQCSAGYGKCRHQGVWLLLSSCCSQHLTEKTALTPVQILGVVISVVSGRLKPSSLGWVTGCPLGLWLLSLFAQEQNKATAAALGTESRCCAHFSVLAGQSPPVSMCRVEGVWIKRVRGGLRPTRRHFTHQSLHVTHVCTAWLGRCVVRLLCWASGLPR